QLADLGRDAAGLVKRNRVGHGGAHPERAFIKMGHELAADEGREGERGDEHGAGGHDNEPGMAQAPAHLAAVPVLHPLQRAVDREPDALLEPVRAQHRHQRQGDKQRADQGEAHGVGHGAEELAAGPAQGIDGEIGGDHHRHRVEDRPVHVLRRADDQVEEVVLAPVLLLELAVDVLHHHHGAVNDDAEVYGADGQQIGGNAVGVEKDEAEQQRQRDGEGDDDGGAQANQQQDEDDQHQDDAAQQVALDRVGGQPHQSAAVVEGPDFYIGRKLPVDLLGLGLDRLQHVLRLRAGEHEDDALDRIVLVIEAELAQARGVADGDGGDVAHVYRGAI